MPITDAFNRANGALVGSTTDTGETWLAGSIGTPAGLSISSNQVTAPTGSGYNVVDTGIQDGTVQATYKGGGIWFALYARESAAGCYRVEWSSSTIYLERDSSSTVLGSAAASLVAGKVVSLKAETVGGATQLTVKIDGVAVITYTDSSASQRTGTRFGLGVTGQIGTLLDDFSFTGLAPASGTVTLSATRQARTASFSLATVADVTLAATRQPRTAAFTFGATVDGAVTLAATRQARTASLTLMTGERYSSLSGVRARRTASFAVAALPSVMLTATRQRRIGTFTTHVATPVVPVPAALRVEGPAPMVVGRALGAVTMNGTQPTYTVSSASIQRARQQIIVDGVDVTFFRGVRTPDVTYTLLAPLRYGPGTLTVPQVAAAHENLGNSRAAELGWLRVEAPVEVNLVLDDPAGIAPPTVVGTVYKGIVADFDRSARTLSLGLGGEANGRASLRDRQDVLFPRVNDIGHQISDAVRDLGLPVYPALGTVTGIEVMTTGGVGHIEHIQNLCAQAWTRQGKYWTVMPNDAGAYVVRQKSDTLIHGTVFFDDARTVANLRRDIAEEPNRIFITGVTPQGQRVRFGVYPGLKQGPVPAFPGHMQSGDTGEGVRLLIGKLHAVGYLRLVEVAGGYDFDVVEAVKDLQDDAGLPKTGEVNLATWEALYDLNVTTTSLEAAHIEPAAQRSAVRRYNRSGSGTILEFNDGYDPEVLPVDRTIDAGVGKTRSQLREFARTVLEAASSPNWVGDITFNSGALLSGTHPVGATVTTADVMDARLLVPTMNLWAPGFDGGTRFNVSACQVNDGGIVTATVDTRFRDALEVWDIIDRNRESRNDPARRRNQKHRSSTIRKDSIGTWDEIGGLLGHDIKLEAGWNVFEVVAATEGTISRFHLELNTPAEFACAVFGRPVDTGFLDDVIGLPLTVEGTKNWRRSAARTRLRDRWHLYSEGTHDEPCGYNEDLKSDGAPLTGTFRTDAGFAYRSESRTLLYVAVWVAAPNTIPLGRIMWPQLEAGA